LSAALVRAACPAPCIPLHPAAGPGWNHADIAELLPDGGNALSAAAVLVGLVDRGAGEQVLLTRRNEGLRHHGGQIAFPGGRIEDGDASPIAAALREAHEEIGLAPAQAQVLGYLDPSPPSPASTSFRWWRRSPPISGAAGSFGSRRSVFEVPLSFLLEPGNARRVELEFRGARRSVLEFHFNDWRVWAPPQRCWSTCASAWSARMNWTTLVGAQELRARLGDPQLRIVDARFVLAGAAPDAGERPGARRTCRAPATCTSTATCPTIASRLARPPSDAGAADFVALLARLGIGPSTRSSCTTPATARWRRRASGGCCACSGIDASPCSMAAGALDALGLPTGRAMRAAPRPRGFAPRFDAAQIASEPKWQRAWRTPGWLLDCARAERFRGEVEPLDRVAGHIPARATGPTPPTCATACSCRRRNCARTSRAARHGARRAVLLNCGSGVHRLRQPAGDGTRGPARRRVYAGSWSGWISDPSRRRSRPARNAPSLLAELLASPRRARPACRRVYQPSMKASSCSSPKPRARRRVGARDACACASIGPCGSASSSFAQFTASVTTSPASVSASTMPIPGIAAIRHGAGDDQALGLCGPAHARSRYWIASGTARPTWVSLRPMRKGPRAITR
jgi:8-oxo-dGTP pyrophosphatase MutT (NUDIX family)/3-mercaptopyruvate sulfurtransferase SseA